MGLLVGPLLTLLGSPLGYPLGIDPALLFLVGQRLVHLAYFVQSTVPWGFTQYLMEDTLLGYVAPAVMEAALALLDTCLVQMSLLFWGALAGRPGKDVL